VTVPSRPWRLAILASHPIQYQVPLFRRLAERPEVEPTVLYCGDFGVRPYEDVGFGRAVRWDVPLLGGYQAEFLPNRSRRPSPSSFWGEVNPAVVGRIRRGGFDAVWVHGWGKASDWMALGAAFSSGVPVLLRGESTLLHPSRGARGAARRELLTRVFRRVSAFLAIGRLNREFYRAHGVPDERIFLAPYAVDNDAFFSRAAECLPRRGELKAGLGIAPGVPVVLFSGKLTGVKRPLDLLRAFVAATAATPAALVYLGDGALRGELEAYVRERGVANVHFAGFRNQSELGRYFAMADVFVLPSGFEPWGLVVNEAMCFGLPVVASDRVGATGDLVDDGGNGFVYPAGDVDALARKLERLLGDAALRGRMGEASRRRIERWGYREDVEAVLAALEGVAAPARRERAA
jgi:glycosyltransferase involved in cell wall biosynthesis